MKQCTKCGIMSNNFSPDKRAKDGLQSACKTCKCIRSIAYNDNKMLDKRGHVNKIVTHRRLMAKRQNTPFEIDLEYAFSIAPDICPALNIPLSWCERKGKPTDNSPSLDKFKPELGYVPGNVYWISRRANMIKTNASIKEIEAVTNWMKKIESA